ncbi:25488_t:CDS:2, partial [Dentiscutata erythropus]
FNNTTRFTIGINAQTSGRAQEVQYPALYAGVLPKRKIKNKIVIITCISRA